MPEEQTDLTGFEDRLKELDKLKEDDYELQTPTQSVDVYWKMSELKVGETINGIFIEKRRYEKEKKEKVVRKDENGKAIFDQITGEPIRDEVTTKEEFFGAIIQTSETIVDDNGLKHPNAIYSVGLSNFLSQRLKGIKPGDGVRIKYTGKQRGKKGFPYNTFEVLIHKFEPDTDETKQAEYTPAQEVIKTGADQLKAQGEKVTATAIIQLASESVEIGEMTPQRLVEVKEELALLIREGKMLE